MKVALVLSRPPGYSETFFRSKISGLLNRGFSVELYVDHDDPGFDLCTKHILPENKFASIIPVVFRLLFTQPIRLFRLCYLLSKDGKEISHISKSVYSNLHLLQSSSVDWVHFGFATIALGREHIADVLHARLAVSFRGFDITRFPLKHPGCYSVLWEKVDRVHVISDSLLHEARSHGLPVTIPYRRITPAVDTSLFSNNSQLPGLQNPIRILTVGRLHWVKGFEYSFEALSELKRNGHPFRYTIIGDGGELDRLILAAGQLGIMEDVEFIGKVPHNELISHYGKSDIYLQYSVQEGFCNAVLEAQALGVPCIVSDAGGLPENVVDGETGWVVPRRKPLLLANKIKEVIHMDAGERNKIRENAIRHVNRDFKLEIQQREFEEFYKC